MTKRGQIKHRQYATQIRDFSRMRWGNITPTDIDCAIDFGGKAYVLAEAKFGPAALPYGQRLAIERFVDSWAETDTKAIGFVVQHFEEGDIDFSQCQVVEYRYQGQWKQYTNTECLKDTIDRWLAFIGLTKYLGDHNVE